MFSNFPEEKTKAVITESFLPKKTEKGRKKRPQRIKKERRKKKEPETANISDEEDRTQNKYDWQMWENVASAKKSV